MLSNENLRSLSQTDIKAAHSKELVDISDIKIEQAPVEEQAEEYFDQIKNPYCFVCGDVKVKVSYSNNQQTLDEALIRYFSNLKHQ